jgi:hypothetical protein
MSGGEIRVIDVSAELVSILIALDLALLADGGRSCGRSLAHSRVHSQGKDPGGQVQQRLRVKGATMFAVAPALKTAAICVFVPAVAVSESLRSLGCLDSRQPQHTSMCRAALWWSLQRTDFRVSWLVPSSEHRWQDPGLPLSKVRTSVLLFLPSTPASACASDV